jgi:hypothetical protein
MSSLDPRVRVEQALGSVEPAHALFELAKQMRDEGMPQAELTELYKSFAEPLSSLADETAYNGLLDTLDCIVGWCQASQKFYP